MSRREAGRLRWALVVSLFAHAGAISLMWLASTQAPEVPAMRVYAVDIVSPPPQLAGPPNPGGGGTPLVEEEVPEPEPEPEPEAPNPPPEPTPPAPETPARREPSPAAQATRTPERQTPASPRREPPKEEAAPAEEPAPRPGGGSGEGTGASTGAEPEAGSPGGENLDVHLRGVQCPSPAYCANIVRQLYRYFRPPTGATRDVAEILFWINQDGSVSDMRFVNNSGSPRFRVAAMEAVEQAGNNKAFGALPRSFQLDRLPVHFSFRPAR